MKTKVLIAVFTLLVAIGVSTFLGSKNSGTVSIVPVDYSQQNMNLNYSVQPAAKVRRVPPTTTVETPVVPVHPSAPEPVVVVPPPEPTPAPLEEEPVIPQPSTPAPTEGINCSGEMYDCPDFTVQEEAQYVYEYCLKATGKDVHGLDGDDDGIACEALAPSDPTEVAPFTSTDAPEPTIESSTLSTGGCCKYCSTGKACGDSCISRSYTCHKAPGCACDS